MPSWIDSLRKFNSTRDSWCVPKKGTPEHAEVMALMGKSPATEAKPKAPKAKAPKAPKEAPAKKRKVRSDKGQKRAKKECPEEIMAPKAPTRVEAIMDKPPQMMMLMDKAPRRKLKLKKPTPSEQLDM